MNEKNYKISKRGDDFLVTWTNKTGLVFHWDFLYNESCGIIDTHSYGPWPDLQKTLHTAFVRSLSGQPCFSQAQARKMIEAACKTYLSNT